MEEGQAVRRLIVTYLRKLTALIAVVALVVGFSGIAGAANIGLLNLQRALDAHPGMSYAEEQYEQTVQDMERQLDAASGEEQEQMIAEFQRMLGMLEYELQEELLNGIIAAAAQVAEEMGYDVVLDFGAVLYGGDDITDQVIEYLLANFE